MIRIEGEKEEEEGTQHSVSVYMFASLVLSLLSIPTSSSVLSSVPFSHLNSHVLFSLVSYSIFDPVVLSSVVVFSPLFPLLLSFFVVFYIVCLLLICLPLCCLLLSLHFIFSSILFLSIVLYFIVLTCLVDCSFLFSFLPESQCPKVPSLCSTIRSSMALLST